MASGSAADAETYVSASTGSGPHATETGAASTGNVRKRPAGHKKRQAPMSSNRANGWLKQFRLETTQELLDLTEHPTFDWKGFLANLPLAQEIVGPGVTGFGFLTMDEVKDPSKKGEVISRNDFVVLRADEIAVRLHPHRAEHLPCTSWLAPKSAVSTRKSGPSWSWRVT